MNSQNNNTNKTSIYTESELLQYRDAFDLFDKDGDGTITVEELKIVMETLGQKPTDKELQEMINQEDADGNGLLDFDEFCAMISKCKRDPLQEEEDIREAFQVFDKANNGKITAVELRSVMTSLGENLTSEEIDEMIKEGDLNGDGIVTFDEFARFFH